MVLAKKKHRLLVCGKVDNQLKIFLSYLGTLLLFALQQSCSWIHIFVERVANGPSIHPWNSFDDLHGIKFQFHSLQVNPANGIFCSTCLINWQKKRLKWNNVLLAILGKAKCARRIFRFNPNSWIERVSIRECFRSGDRGWEIFGDRVSGWNNN